MVLFRLLLIYYDITGEMSVKQPATKKTPKKSEKSPESEILKKAAPKINLFNRKKLIIILSFFLILALVLVSTILSFELIFSQKVYPKVNIGQLPVGGMNKTQVLNLINEKTAQLEQSTKNLKYEDKSWNLEPDQIGLFFDEQKTTDLAFKAGRNCGNYLCDVKNKIQILIKGETIESVFSFNDESLNKFFDLISSQVEKKEVKPKIILESGKPKIEGGQAGLKLNRMETKKKILEDYKNLKSEPKDISVIKQEDFANLDLEKLLPVAEKIINKKITLKSPEKSWTLEKEKILDYLVIEPKVSPKLDQADDITSPKGQETQEAILVFGGENFDKLISEIKNQVETTARDARFQFSEGKVTLFEPSVDGKKIEIDKLQESLNSQLDSDQKETTIEIPLTVSPAKIKTSEVNNFGIEKMIGRGWSNYSGSAEGRIHNVLLAASKINGTLIPPDGVFSFNQTVGEVSSKTGYSQAYIISQGQTILGDGGGVCQVSTTVFRGAFYSGLPILERTAHAYRVGYYEQGTPVGLDATVYSPTVDLKFKNNTGSYILIQGYADTANHLLYMDFYGRDDGRQVIVSKPTITNQTSPPQARYEQDDSLPSGTIKQVDFSAWGANVTVTRKVVRGVEVLENNIFRSNYRPWQAVFKYGPGTQLPS